MVHLIVHERLQEGLVPSCSTIKLECMQALTIGTVARPNAVPTSNSASDHPRMKMRNSAYPWMKTWTTMATLERQQLSAGPRSRASGSQGECMLPATSRQ